MFRLEVHVRITDESGQHVSGAAAPPDSFLFSSLFDGEGGVVVGGPSHMPNFCGEMADPFSGASPAEALLCCGLVDELVSRTSGRDDGVFGPPGAWKVGFGGDWNLFCSDPTRKGGPEDDRASPWSSEEDQNLSEGDEENQNLWASLCGPGDPYHPLSFSAPIRTGREEAPPPAGPGPLVLRSDSEVSWGSSDGSSLGEDAEQLLAFFSSSDPYDPMCFTACSGTAAAAREDEEEERLWTSLGDPHRPPSSRTAAPSPAPEADVPRTAKPALRERPPRRRHRHPETTVVPWTRPTKLDGGGGSSGPAHKKVTTP